MSEDGPATPSRTQGPPESGTRPQVLVLRALGLGDLLTVVPCLRALRRNMPAHDIVLAAPGRLAAAVAATGLVDRLLPAGASGRGVPSALAWAGPAPEVAVDLHGNGPASHDLLERLRPRRLLAFGQPGEPGTPGPAWRADEHERARWCRLLNWYGIEADPADLRIPRPPCPSPAPGAVVLHPGADSAARRWPPERFATVARSLDRAGHRVVVTAGAGEGRLAHRVAAAAGLPPGAVLGGADDVPFPRLCALVAEARCVVVGDTGLAHLATALSTPSVVLFGPVAPRLWGPPPGTRHRVLWHPRPGEDPLRPGDAHGPVPDARLLRISAEEVLRAAEVLLGPAADTAPAPG
ncbi:glycosyltransferase family 9 protein [Streptomyces turgidiscabies]|uniref:ADP-heptose:LPS heptosyltransferase n=1 Tax=Streptomyces turgidiscabies TaxID=85558 RepID=A0ABU0S0H8_9ACTN|nr:glycosyltransferase family 9 protein [Streptomyces turgidiscabies]MDQ0937715.1 ADP-heptose:LPS heptosyltransferase [Streptomyces turgidiscabies]